MGWFANAANTYRIQSTIDGIRAGLAKKTPITFNQSFSELAMYDPKQQRTTEADVFGILDDQFKS